MKKHLIFLILFLPLYCNVHIAFAIEPGSYRCKADRTVGIKPNERPEEVHHITPEQIKWRYKNRVSGNINPGMKEFTINIKEVVDAKKDAGIECPSPLGSLSLSFFLVCDTNFTKYILEIPDEKKSELEWGKKILVSANGNQFYGDYTEFLIFGKYIHVYNLTVLGGGRSSFLEEGQCEAMSQ